MSQTDTRWCSFCAKSRVSEIVSISKDRKLTAVRSKCPNCKIEATYWYSQQELSDRGLTIEEEKNGEEED